jgi:phenylalanyl-tRNA synthetase beta chain
VVVDEQLEAASLSSAITEAGGEMLRRVFLFDSYRGKQVADGKKSLAFSLRFQSDERTLTDEEITTALTRVVRALEEKFGARLRA